MRKYSQSGFTLVELIVTITILAILGTLGYISFRGYSKDARNSNRVSDMKVISKGLDLYFQKNDVYPLPDNAQSISYSGGLAWTQGVFGSGMLSTIRRVSNIPVDPLTKSLYSYSLGSNRKTYQLAGAFESGFFSYNIPLISQGYAFTSGELSGYTFGNFISPDILVSHSGTCSVITSPSILLSDLPSGNILQAGEFYNYTYIGSPHIPASYSGGVEAGNPQTGFQITQVFSGCTMNTMAELELYIARLSTAYQSLASIEKYNSLIYKSNTKEFKKQSVSNLESIGLTVAIGLKNELDAPPPEKIFGDNFTNISGTFLIPTHIQSSGSGAWNIISGGSTSAYTITSNTLTKSDNSLTQIFPAVIPLPILTNSKVSYRINNFSSGVIETYLRYTDANNYYKLRLSEGNYQVMRRLGGGDSIFNTISDASITSGVSITFSAIGDTLVFAVDGTEKENIVAGGIDNIGPPLLFLENTAASIDDFSYTYQ